MNPSLSTFPLLSSCTHVLIPMATAPTDPSDPLWGTTKRERKAVLQQELEDLYGPHAGDRDVRLYLKRRELDATRTRPSRRGGFPLDDSFEQPGTFLKLSADFQRTICEFGGLVRQAICQWQPWKAEPPPHRPV